MVAVRHHLHRPPMERLAVIILEVRRPSRDRRGRVLGVRMRSAYHRTWRSRSQHISRFLLTW